MQFHLPNPAMVVSHLPTDNIKPELINSNFKLAPIYQSIPEQRYNCSSSVSNCDSDMSRRPSVSSIASSGFHPSRSASPAFSNCTLESRYGGTRPQDRLRLQASHAYPYTTPTQEPAAVASHTGGKASKKKREDRKQYSKRASTGPISSKVQKSDNEAGNRYCQALDQAELAHVCKEANPNIENTAAPRHGGSGAWIMLKNNNIAWDVRQDGIEPSMWNKSSVNGSAILQLRHSNKQFADTSRWVDEMLKRWSSTSKEQLYEQLIQFQQCQAAAVSTRGEAHWKTGSERMVHER